jgi:ElaB/YqjD/DUF883 family membrane-anchored ribosome-binding protein
VHLVKATTAASRKEIPPEGLDADVDRLAAMLRQIATRADDLIASVRKSGGGRYQDSVRRLERQLRRTQADLEELEAGLARRPNDALRMMDGVAHDHPYAAAAAGVLMGAALGTLVVVLIGRR